MITYLLLGLLVVSAILCGVGTLRLVEPEKRFPSPIFMFELIGRWWSVPSDRADPFVSSAVAGFVMFFATWIPLVFFL